MSVIVLTEDEARNLEVLLPDVPDVHEVVLVDVRLRDGAADVVRRHLPNLQVINQTRTDKDNALVCGMRVVTGDIVVTLDIDGSADSHEIPALVDALVRGVDFVKGLWYVTDRGFVDLTRLCSAGNWGLNVLSNLSPDTKSTDLYYGYNAFWKDTVPVLRSPDPDLPQPVDGNCPQGDGLEIETLIAVRTTQAGLMVTGVPSFELNRIHGESNLRTFADGQWVLRTITTETARHGRVKCARLVAAPARHHLPICRLRSREWEHLSA